jgi:hypothetical protein
VTPWVFLLTIIREGLLGETRYTFVDQTGLFNETVDAFVHWCQRPLPPGGTNQFPGGTFTRCWTSAFHGAQ